MKRAPKPIGDILSELMARRGFAQIQSAAAYAEGWNAAAGPMVAKYTRVGTLRRGTLEVVVANSTLVQELGFQKSMLLKKLAERLPDQGIKAIRFRVGKID